MSAQENTETQFRLSRDSKSSRQPNTPMFYAHGVFMVSMIVATVFLLIVSAVPDDATPWVLWPLTGVWAVVTAWAILAARISYKEELADVQD